ncbi:MAG: glycosyltransferase family 39 protein, partial [Thermoanaerobaculum sp.]|nr:glycosyltransferase family 39 protein [Thermoanaerobaculum sp.]
MKALARWCHLTAAGVLVGAAALAPLVDRDEPRYAQAVREMRQTGDLLVPRNFAQLRPDKPILIYWLQWVATGLVGERELGFRLPSLVAAWAWLWLSLLLARELVGQQRLLVLPGIALAGLFATPDALVGALTTACLLALLKGAQGKSPGWVAAGWALLGFGLLAKGPVTPLFVAPALAGYLGRDGPGWRRVTPWWGPLVTLAVAGPWFWAVNEATQWEFARKAVARHLWQRTLQPLESHGVAGPLGVLLGPPFYLAALAVATFPLGVGVWQFLRRQKHQDPQLWRTVVWGVGIPLAVLSLVATKLPHYILPAVPLLLATTPVTSRQQVTAALASTGLALAFLASARLTPYREMGAALQGLPQPACARPLLEPSLRF